MSRHLLEIGSVCRPHGLRGELRVKLHDPTSSALEAAKHLWTVKDKEPAESLTRQKVLIDRVELPKLEPGEFYLADLPGCEVKTADGEHVGVVADVMSIGAQAQLVIHRLDREPAWVPIVPEILTGYDAERRLVVIEPPAGLLDLDRN